MITRNCDAALIVILNQHISIKSRLAQQVKNKTGADASDISARFIKQMTFIEP